MKINKTEFVTNFFAGAGIVSVVAGVGAIAGLLIPSIGVSSGLTYGVALGIICSGVFFGLIEKKKKEAKEKMFNGS
jgi:hypothetical protein